MNDIVEIENIIPKAYADAIEERVTGKQFQWYLNKSLVSPDFFTDRKKYLEYNPVGFNHFLYEENQVQSPQFEFFYPLILTIQDLKLFPNNSLERARFNLTEPRNSDLKNHMPHIDSWYEHYVVIYYVNDNNGSTFIFDQVNENFELDSKEFIETTNFTIKKEIKPKKGKIVAFNGQHYHASSYSTNSPYRVVLNMNFSGLDHVLL